MQVKITSVMGKGSPASCHCNYCIRIECSRADKLYHAENIESPSGGDIKMAHPGKEETGGKCTT